MFLLTPRPLPLEIAWNKCLWYLHHELGERFPDESMEIYRKIKVVDPSISHSPLIHEKIGDKTKAEVVKSLLHVFELPLHGKLDPLKVQNSFGQFLSSTIAKSTYKALYSKKKGKLPPPEVIYKYYAQLIHHKELRDYSMFALFLLLFPTGNAISERGFSALNATCTKGRSSMSVKQALAAMIISFNGDSYKNFKESLDRDSMANGSEWWGFVPPTNFNR